MVQQNQLSNPEIQQEINAVIEKDATLNREISQLKDSECDCENENRTRLWHFPIICTIAGVLGEFAYWLWDYLMYSDINVESKIMAIILLTLYEVSIGMFFIMATIFIALQCG